MHWAAMTTPSKANTKTIQKIAVVVVVLVVVVIVEVEVVMVMNQHFFFGDNP